MSEKKEVVKQHSVLNYIPQNDMGISDDYLNLLIAKHNRIPKTQVIEFLNKAILCGADPRLDQVFLIERDVYEGGRKTGERTATTIFSYHFLLAKARSTGELSHYKIKTEVIDKFDPVSGEFKKMLASTVDAIRKHKDGSTEEASYTAYYDEYVVKNSRNEINANWESKPYVMLEKCAIAGAIRRLFSEVLGNMYIHEEMDLNDTIFDEIQNQQIFEAEFKEKEKKDAAILKTFEAKKTGDFDETMASIFSGFKILTEGKTKEEKGKALIELADVSRWDDLKLKKIDELISIDNKIRQRIEQEGILNN